MAASARRIGLVAALLAAGAAWGPPARAQAEAAPGGADEAELVAALPALVTPETVRAIDDGVRWLARNQQRDGSLGEAGGMGAYPVAMSSLAGMAFLAHGDTPVRGHYAPQVRRIVRYLTDRRQVRQSGLITSPSEEGHAMYGHGFATMFLAQALGEEGDPELEQRIRQVLRGAIGLTARAQSGPGGWYYTADSGHDEGSVTVTQVQALRACQNAGLAVPAAVVRKAVAYIELSANSDGGISYSADSKGHSMPAISAAACAVLYNAGQYDSKVARRCLEFCRRTVQVGDRGGFGHWFYTHLYLSQAYWQAGGRDWERYYPQVRAALLASQGKDGSWEGDGVGRVYGTSLAVVILALPFERVPLYMR